MKRASWTLSRKKTCCLTGLAYSVAVRFLVQYLVVSVVLVGLAWGAASIDVNGKTLVGHFLSSRVGTKVQYLIKKVVKRLTSSSDKPKKKQKARALDPAPKAKKSPARFRADTKRAEAKRAKIKRAKAKPKPALPVRVTRAAPLVRRAAAPPSGPPWKVQRAEGAYRRVARLHQATRELAESN